MFMKLILYIGIFYPFNKQPVFLKLIWENKSKNNGLIIFIVILLNINSKNNCYINYMF